MRFQCLFNNFVSPTLLKSAFKQRWWNRDRTEWTITWITETRRCDFTVLLKERILKVMQTLKRWQCKNLVNSVNEDKKELCKKFNPNGHRALRLEPRNTSRTALSGVLYYTKARLRPAEKISFYIPSGCQKVSEASVSALLILAVLWRRVSGVQKTVESCSSVSASAALNVLLNNHAAVSEERAGHALLQRPHVRTGVKGLHGSQRWTLAAHDAACHVDLPVQDHCTGKYIISELV